jgi:DNA-binding NarL/FixJ family response regulator
LSGEKAKAMLNVFIVSSHLMFSHGLENLLQEDAEINVMGQETNMEQAIKQIKKLHPDAIIIYSDDVQLTSRLTIVEILKASPDTKVIHLSLQNNVFYVYQATQWVATSLDDLLQAVKVTMPPENEDNSSLNPGWSQSNISQEQNLNL